MRYAYKNETLHHSTLELVHQVAREELVDVKHCNMKTFIVERTHAHALPHYNVINEEMTGPITRVITYVSTVEVFANQVINVLLTADQEININGKWLR